MLPSINAKVRKPPAITLTAPIVGAIVVGFIVLGLLLGWQVRHSILWAYNLQRAGAYRAVALTYPEPRFSDSLPELTNAEANQQALSHLAAAIVRRPDDPFAYRLAGESYLAARELVQAVSIMETGMARSGGEPLLGWQLALAYEQIHDAIEASPGESLLAGFAADIPDAPLIPIETPYCEAGDVRTCYSGTFTAALPYAAFPDGGSVTADALFLHPPARVTLPLTVPEGEPALTFLLGLDPHAKTWGTDGATFQVWIVEADGGILSVFERTVIGGELVQGWIPASIDLSPWAGEEIAISLGTTAGPQNDNSGDWVGFGNLYLTNRQTAQYRDLMPEGRFGQAVARASLSGAHLAERGDEDLYAARLERAQRWYRRAQWTGEDFSSTLAYARFRVISANESFEAALPHLEEAVKMDSGWSGNVNRFFAFQAYGRWLTEQEVYWASEGYLLVTLALFDPLPPTMYTATAESHRLLSMTYIATNRPDDALLHAREALRLDPRNYLVQRQFGYALLASDRALASQAELAFDRSLELHDSAENWVDIVRIWLGSGESARAQTACATALQKYSAEQLEYSCFSDEDGASTIAYRDYLELLGDGDESGALERLEDAVEIDGGWAHSAERFNAWLAWMDYLIESERHAEAVVAGQIALAIVPDYVGVERVANINHEIGLALAEEQRYQEALPYIQAAMGDDVSPYLQMDYARILYRANPGNPAAARAEFATALANKDAYPEMRLEIIDFWYSEQQAAEAALLCAESGITDAERVLCVPQGVKASSGAAFQRYLDAVAAGAGASALSDLEEAVTLDYGWQLLTYRHRAWRAWGDHLAAEDDINGAIAALETAVAARDRRVSDISIAAAAANLGVLYSGEERYEEAVDAFETAIENNPEHVYAHINLARTLYTRNPNNLARPRALMREALRLAPNDVTIWRTVVIFWTLAEVPEEAASICAQAAQEIRNQIGDWCLPANTEPSRDNYFRFSQLRLTDPTAAFAALEIAVTTDLGWTNAEQRFAAWNAWGEHLLTTQRFENAASALEFAVSIAPETTPARDLAVAHRAWAMALYGLDDLDGALAQSEAAVAVDPDFAFAHEYLARMLYETGSSAASESAFREAMRLAPDSAIIWSGIARFWMEREEFALARQLCNEAELLTEALELYCWDGDTPSMVYYNEYEIERENGNSAAALEALEQAVMLDDGWAHSAARYLAWRAWGIELFDANRNEEAISALLVAIESAPPSTADSVRATDYFYLGLGYNRIGSITEALAAYEQAVSLNPNHASMRLNYGYVLYNAVPRDVAAVAAQFSAALDIAPDDLSIWEGVIGFWQRNNEAAELAAVCERAAISSLAADLAPLCAAP